MLPEEGGGDATEREWVAGQRAREDCRLPPRRFIGAVRASEIRPPPNSPTLPEPPIRPSNPAALGAGALPAPAESCCVVDLILI